MDSTPLVSVVMPTKNRPVAVPEAVQSILDGDYQRFELFVIDQSPDETTRDALGPLLDDPRVHYYPNRRPGVGAPSSRNIGIALSSGELLVMIDDDITAPADWLSSIVSEFQRDASLEVLIGSLTAPPYDRSAGYIPEFRPDNRTPKWRLVTLISAANIGLRRSLLSRIGGYDELIGPGGRFGVGDDSDFAMRMIRAGARWRAFPEISVIHTHGFRPGRAGHDLMMTYQDGIGAVFGRAARRGYIEPTLWFLGRELFYLGYGLVALLRHRSLAGLELSRQRFKGFGEGLLARPSEGYVDEGGLARLRAQILSQIVGAPPRSGVSGWPT